MKLETALQLTSLLLLSTMLIFLVFYVSQLSSTFVEVFSPKNLVEVEFAGRVIGSYLWVNRSQDLIIQAFVLFVAALGGLLFFRDEV